MEKITLKAAVRNEFGKEVCKHLRKQGMIPGVVYKGGKIGVNIQVNDNELWHVLHTEAGENAIITMEISDEGKETSKTVIVQETQVDPINDKFVHVDFHEISMKEKIKVKVPITLKGEALGVVEEEGVLAQVTWEIEVECLPAAVPEHINVNVESLKIGDALHINDIDAGEGVTVLGDEEQVIATVHAPQAEEEEPAEEVEGEETDEPEVIKKGKKEDEEAEEAPPAE